MLYGEDFLVKFLTGPLRQNLRSVIHRKMGQSPLTVLLEVLSFPTMPMENQMSLAMWKPLPIIGMI